MNLTIATGNPHKIAEVRAALARLPKWQVGGLPPNTPDIEETGSTFAENAAQKAIHYSRYVDGPALADDSGLCIDTLDGRPGIFSARYAENDNARIRRVLDEMKSIPDDKRNAAFVCALAVAERGNVSWTVECRIAGRITRTPSGANGFGYDPIFWLPEFGCTMAEIGMEEKNRISHRGQAIQALVRYFFCTEDAG